MTQQQVRHVPSNASDDTAVAARANRRKELIVSNQLWQLAAEGRLFIAASGIEETHADGGATLSDLAPTYVLRAPDSGTIVVPIEFEFELTTEGGAAPDIAVTYLQEGSAGIAYTAGTPQTVLNLLGGSGVTAGGRTAKAIFDLNPTLGASTDAQNAVVRANRNTPDNYVSVELVTTTSGGIGGGLDSMGTFTWKPSYPIFLNAGSMIAVHFTTATSDSKWRYQAVWAELDSDDVL